MMIYGFCIIFVCQCSVLNNKKLRSNNNMNGMVVDYEGYATIKIEYYFFIIED
jgi:hypothetical protein